MQALTNQERVLIIAACLGILLATGLIMMCKLLPFCNICKRWNTSDSEKSKSKEKEKSLKEQGHGAARYGSTVVTREQGNASRKPVEMRYATALPKAASDCETQRFTSNGVESAQQSLTARTRAQYWSTTSLSDTSSKDSSPAMRHEPAFPLLSDAVDHQGIVDLALQYEAPDEKLSVWLRSIRGFPRSVYGSANDCCVKLLVIRDSRRRWRRRSQLSLEDIRADVGYDVTELKSSHVRRTVNLEFNEKFAVELRDRDRKYTQIKLLAYATDRSGNQSTIGESHIWLAKVAFPVPKPRGEAWFETKLPLKQIEKNLGELFLALTYLPTAQRLTVSTLKAVNLKAAPGQTTEPNPYIKAALVLRGKALEKHKTSAISHCSNPTFPETLTFDLPAQELDRVTLVVSVMHKIAHSADGSSTDQDAGCAGDVAALGGPKRRRSSGNIFEDAKIESGKLYRPKSRSTNSMLGKAQLLGRVAFNTLAKGSPRAHWMEAVLHPRQQVAQWHKLHT